MRRSVRTIEDRFWSKVDKGSDCWLWTGGLNEDGYGRFTLTEPYRIALAHRVSWELSYGPIPPGMNVLHRCDNPQCVNPADLWLGTQADNIADMMAKGRWRGAAPTTCPAGHPYNEANTRTIPTKTGGVHRACRACGRDLARRKRGPGLSERERHQAKSEGSRLAMHKRWHVSRSIFNPSCVLCQSEADGTYACVPS